MMFCIPKYLEDLVDLGITGEKGLAGAHFRKNAAHGPHVDACRVLPTAEQNLRRAVPQRDDLFMSVPARTASVCMLYLMCICPQWYTKCASETEIRQLEVAVLVDQQILRLQIAMQYAM